MSGMIEKYLPASALRLGVELQTTNFNAANGRVYGVNAATTVNVQLPAPSSSFHVVIKDMSGDVANKTITIVRNGVENIDGQAANLVLKSNYQAVMLISDGTDWYII